MICGGKNIDNCRKIFFFRDNFKYLLRIKLLLHKDHDTHSKNLFRIIHLLLAHFNNFFVHQKRKARIFFTGIPTNNHLVVSVHTISSHKIVYSLTGQRLKQVRKQSRNKIKKIKTNLESQKAPEISLGKNFNTGNEIIF